MATAPHNAFDPFDRRTGNGSRNAADDWLDEASIFHNEWGSTATTTFNPEDTDAHGNKIPAYKQKRLERLYEWHNGKGESTRKDTIRQSHIENDARAFMSTLEMPELQRKRVLNILEDLDISSRTFGRNCPYEKIILALCSLVSDRELSRRLDRDDNPSAVDERLFLTDEFRELMDVTGMSTSDHRRIRERIRTISDEF